ncbi:hypothetical protein D6D23_09467 [Aureobasidium pullulans]|nr:hypothetical protein D6D23_09467 [Aureobasidium pullulans]
MTCRISRFTTYQGIAFQKRTTHTTTHTAGRGQSRSLSFFPQPSQQKKKKSHHQPSISWRNSSPSSPALASAITKTTTTTRPSRVLS